MVFFEKVVLAPPDPILGLTIAFQNDARPHKVNLGVGLYKTEELKTPVLSSVKEAEKALLETQKSKEYLPIDGSALFIDQMGNLVFGKGPWAGNKQRIAGLQTVGGTGALKIGGTFLKEEADHPLWVSTPTWPNHRGVFLSCGLKVEQYPYYDMKKHGVDFSQLLDFFAGLPERTIVLLHASCHNPTGCDPSKEEWKALCDLFKRKKLIPFFDFAYQGLGDGIEEDAEAVRYFLKEGLEMLVAVSSAKNFSLYGERVGCLFVVADSSKIAEHILSRIKQMVRTTYSNPPLHGASVVAHVLQMPHLRKVWEDEVVQMRKRIRFMRSELHEKLTSAGSKELFQHISYGKGMFCFTGLQKTQVEKIIADYGIYMTLDGRINVSGLNQKNIDYVVDAFVAVS